jgi:hypothetical protein
MSDEALWHSRKERKEDEARSPVSELGGVFTLTEERVRDRKQAREKSPSARAFEDWVNVIFDATGRAVHGLLPIGVLAFSGLELVNPDLLGHQHISAEFAQTLLGVSLGALGMDFLGRRGPRR